MTVESKVVEIRSTLWFGRGNVMRMKRSRKGLSVNCCGGSNFIYMDGRGCRVNFLCADVKRLTSRTGERGSAA